MTVVNSGIKNERYLKSVLPKINYISSQWWHKSLVIKITGSKQLMFSAKINGSYNHC